MEEDGTHFCRCNIGWQRESCDDCVPYWECPYKGEGACEKPNECRCPTSTSDPDGLCESFFTPANILGEMVISKGAPAALIQNKEYN